MLQDAVIEHDAPLAANGLRFIFIFFDFLDPVLDPFKSIPKGLLLMEDLPDPIGPMKTMLIAVATIDQHRVLLNMREPDRLGKIALHFQILAKVTWFGFLYCSWFYY